MPKNVRVYLWLLLALLGGGIALAALSLPRLNRAREAGGYPRCGSNLRQLGQALTLYAQANAGRLPETLEDLLRADLDLTPHVFLCPSSNDEVMPGLSSTQPSADEMVARIRERGMPTSLSDPPPPTTRPRYFSYIYAASGRTIDQITPRTVLVYEPLSNHDGDGAHVLFGDGDAEWLNRDAAIKLLAPSAAPTTSAPTR